MHLDNTDIVECFAEDRGTTENLDIIYNAQDAQKGLYAVWDTNHKEALICIDDKQRQEIALIHEDDLEKTIRHLTLIKERIRAVEAGYQNK